jgi:hypothetical protein
MVNGVPTITRYEHIPGAAAVDPIDLSGYKKTPSYHFKKHGEMPLRSAVAGYDIAKGLQQLDSPAGYGDIVAGGLMAAAPLIPKTVKGIPTRAIATGLGLVPVGSEAISSAVAADVPGTAFDVATGLMGPAGMALTPSELGAGTVQRKREVYRPGMNVLQGSRLEPEQRADGGSIGEPSISQMQTEIIQSKKKPVKSKKLTIDALPPGLSKDQFEHLCKGGYVEMPKHLAEGGDPKKPRPA